MTARFADHLVRVATLTERDALTSVPTGALAAVDEDAGIYQWDGSAWGVWRATSPQALAGLTDVDLTGVVDGDTLTFDIASGLWVADAPSGGGAATFHGCAVESAVNQSIPSTTWTVVTFPAEVFDTDGMHDNSTNPTRITIPAGLAGKWSFTATTKLAGGGGNLRAVAWKKNGADLDPRYGSNYGVPSPTDFTVRTVSVDLDLAAGDYIEHRIRHDNGSALNLNGAYLTATYLG